MSILFSKKAQGSIEFVGILAVLLFIILGSIGFIQSRTISVLKERNDLLVESMGRTIEKEIILALEIDGYYYREFNLPFTIGGLNYSISNPGPSDLVINLENSKQILFLPSNITGNFAKGKNVIRKVNNDIFINV